MQISNIFVLDATTYARNAIVTFGKLNINTGYWPSNIYNSKMDQDKSQFYFK